MESFKDQLAASSLPNLLRVALEAKTKIFAFYESPQDALDEFGKMILLAEFNNDPSLELCHGEGKGHCFVRVDFLKTVLATAPPSTIRDYATLVSIFRERGYKVRRLMSAFAEYIEVESVNLSDMIVPPAIIAMVPESIARENVVIPIGEANGMLQIVVSNPSDFETITKLQFILARDIQLAVAPEEQIVVANNRHYGQS